MTLVCPTCTTEAIENHAGGKTFWYCQTCRVEVVQATPLPLPASVLGLTGLAGWLPDSGNALPRFQLRSGLFGTTPMTYHTWAGLLPIHHNPFLELLNEGAQPPSPPSYSTLQAVAEKEFQQAFDKIKAALLKDIQ
jgi:hypothetical protein